MKTISLIRANFVGTSFTVYDNGVNPNKGEALPDGSNCRQELAAIIYVSMYYTNAKCVCRCIEVGDCDILRHRDSGIMTYHDCENYHDCHTLQTFGTKK